MSMELHTDGPRTGRSWSNRLWRKCPWQAIQNDPGLGFCWYSDFVAYSSIAATNTEWTVTQANSSGTILSSSLHGGSMTVSAGASTDAYGVTAGNPGGVASACVTPSASTTIYLEALLKYTTQTASLYGAWWFGLATQAEGLSSAGAPAGTNRIGFLVENSADLLFNYKDAGGSEYEVDTTWNISLTTAKWIKLGFRIDGLTSVTYFINGVPVSVAATSTYPLPDAIMNICVANVANGGTGTPLQEYDWIRFACVDQSWASVSTTSG